MLAMYMLGGPGKVQAQFTQANGTVIGNQTVIPIPIYPAGYAMVQALIYYPDDYNLPANASKRYPLYIFMHGTGEGHTNDITEVNRTSLPSLIAAGLKPYAIDSLTGDTIKFIVVSPHAASTDYSYSYPHLKYTIPYLYANYRVDTSCVFVGGLSAGARGTWSVVMGDAGPTPPLPDTALAKRITGIMPMANGGYDNALADASMAAALDTNLRRGLAVLYIIGDQDPGYNAIGYHAYAHADTTYGVAGRWFHKVIVGGIHDSGVWNKPFPLNARVWSTTQNAWTQMWNLRKGPPVSRPGNSQALSAGTTSTTLNGSGSTAGYGHTLTAYLWAQVSGPNTATIATSAAVSTTISGLVAGTYVFSLKVTDNGSQTNTAQVTVTVNAPSGPGPNIVRKVACTEYKAAFLYTDSSVRSFVYNTVSGHVEFMPFTLSAGRKAVDVSSGFNVITILDDQGYVWVSDLGAYTCTRSNTDATGAAFNGNVSLFGYFNTYLSIRNDGSIWYWGLDDYHFYSGSGTTITAAKKLRIPPGVQFTKLATGSSLLGLTTTGDVYMWDKGDSNYKKVILPRPASDIAASHLAYFVAVVPDNIAVSTFGYPYAFGPEYGHYLSSTQAYYTAPVACKTLWGMSYPIQEISSNENAIHYIDSLGNLYGLGDNVQGELGNGVEKVNHTELYPTPYAWSWTKNEYLQPAPVQVLPGTKFKKLFTGNSYVYYHYVTDDKDSLYFWGRNKSFVGGDGAVNNQESTYPNAMDVLKPSMRTPIAISPTQTTSYNFTLYTLKATAKQTVSTTTANLSATATASLLTAGGKPNYGYTITKYLWTKVSGPAGGTITHPDSLHTTVTGLAIGTYIFNIQTTDNNTATISAKDTIVVASAPVANAGADQTITLPVDSVILSGSGSSGSIASYLWTQISGPVTAVIDFPGQVSTNVSSLTVDSFYFKLTVTDSLGSTASDTVKVKVNQAAAGTPVFIVSAGPDRVITLPTSSVTLTGVATVHNATPSTCLWTQVSGPSTAGISGSGSITPTISSLVAGAYVIKVKLVSTTGLSDSDFVKITVNNTGGAALQPVTATGAGLVIDPAASQARTIGIYPNPVGGDQQLAVEGHNWNSGTVKLRIYDLNGRLVKQLELKSVAAYFRQTVSVAGMAKGAYLLSIEQDGQKPALQKFIVK
jgi:alpha-tubulin suppressor-like RCC1 family protein